MNSNSEKIDVKSTEPSANAQAPIDLAAIYNVAKSNWRFMAKVTGVLVLVVGIYVFSLPRGWDASVVLAPEMSNTSSLPGNLSSMASMVGLDLNSMSGDDAIYPEIYPDIVTSKQFLVELFSVTISTADGSYTGTIEDYLTHHQKHAWWGVIFRPIRKAMKKLFSKTPTGPSVAEKPDPFWLSRDQDELCESLSSVITCSVDKKTNVITITMRSQDALVSAMMADSIRQKLQDYIISYRTAKAVNDQEFFEKLRDEARVKYDEAMQNYASYSDSHLNSILQSSISERDKLENELQLAFNVYNQMSQQVQMARAKVQERTVVQCATVPQKPASPKRMIIVAAMIFVGLLGSLAYLILWPEKQR